MNKLTDQIQAEVNKVVLGKEDIVRKVLLAILAQGHVLLEDVPGVGKTTLAKAFSKTLGLDSKRVQFTSDTLPSDIIGFSVFDKADGKLKYQSGAIMTNLLLADEINRTSSKTQSALLEAMEELQVTVDGVTRPLPKPFIVLATENPGGFCGYADAARIPAGPFHAPTEHGLSQSGQHGGTAEGSPSCGPALCLPDSDFPCRAGKAHCRGQQYPCGRPNL